MAAKKRKKRASRKKPATRRKATPRKAKKKAARTVARKKAARKKPAARKAKAAKKKKTTTRKKAKKTAAKTGKAAKKTAKTARRKKTARRVRDAALKRHDEAFLVGLYRDMVRTRALDNRVEALYKQGKLVAGCYSSRGQEGCSVGSTAAVRRDDVVGPMIRNLGSMLRHGIPMTYVLANYLGRSTGPTKGRDGSSHFGSLEHNVLGPISMLGSLIPVCAGAALAFQMRGEDRVALTWIGDGGSNVGDFHEGLNFAGVMKLPMVLILENNKWAYSTPIKYQTAAKDFVCRAEGYGIQGVSVDGNDVLAMYEVTKKAVDRARAGRGPTLIEADTMRMRGHAIHDDAKYVPKRQFTEWEAKDPIVTFADRLRRAGILDEDVEHTIDAEVKAEVEACTEDALAMPVPTGDAATELGDVYA